MLGNDEDRERSTSTKRRKLNTAIPDKGATQVQPPLDCMSVDNLTDIQEQSVNKVRSYQLQSPNSLIAANDGVLDYSVKQIAKPLPRSGCIFRGVFDTLRDLNVHHRSHAISCRPHSSNSNLILLFAIFVVLIGMVQVAQASAPPLATSTLSIYALNANGLVQPVKQSSINSVIRARYPQAFVLGETKTKTKLSKSLPFDEYDIYEESGEQDESHHPVK